MQGLAQIPLDSSRLDTSRLDTFDVSIEPLHFGCVDCRACRTARLDTLVSTLSTRRTCRVVSRRDDRDEPSGIWTQY